MLKVFGINAAGIKSKTDSFNEILTRVKPEIWMMEETKLKENENIKCEALNDYQVFYKSRQESQGGGLAIGVNKKLESTFVKEGDEGTEVMSIVVVVGKMQIRVLVGYGVQENATKDKKDKFWEFIENEVIEAESQGQGILIQMDGNLHAGKELVKNDPNPQNTNGRLFMQFLQRNTCLTVVNSMSICEGTITRRRIVENRTEQAVLDFFLVNAKLLPFLSKMIIDEKREFCVSNFAQHKKNKRVIESDHNSLLLEIKIEFSSKKPDRQEIFNFKNKKAQQAFLEETENNIELINCFENKLPFQVQSKNWAKIFNSIIYKCFKKVRICRDKKNGNSKIALLQERLKLKMDMKSKIIDNVCKGKIEQRIEEIEEVIGNEIVDEYHTDIVEIIKSFGGDETSLEGSGRLKLWNLLKRKCPKKKFAFPVGKKNRKGKLITNHDGLKKLYLKTYKDRLRNRPIKEEFSEIKNLKLMLFNMRKELCEGRKSEPWDMKDLNAVLKDLKKAKARDPNGWINEMFMEGIAGKNLKKSMLMYFNKMKEENQTPEFMKIADVTTFYKGKGDKSSMESDRGIFVVSVFRSIMMKLIYRDIYKTIDGSMSDSQVGSRKGKNIRNHIWVLNSVVTDTLSSKKKKSIDVQIYDFKQCFDSLWLEECLNDMYTGGMKNDKLNLLHSVNENVNIVVKTPVGKTSKESINNVIIQGDVFGPMLCSKQVDSFGKECLEEKKYTYLYRGKVEIPPLTMVDDVLCISECGYKSVMVNEYMQCKSDSKKLQFGPSKCKKIHIGKQEKDFKCHALFVEKWEEREVTQGNTQNSIIQDVCIGREKMEEKFEEKYLGDIISADGKNLKNIQSRVNKGKGISRKIVNILEAIPFGRLYFQVAVLLRNTLLVSSLLCNSEAWFGLTNKELDLLETVDVIFLRNILMAPKSTPKEMFYLELGILPLREIIRERRLNFLHYILKQDAQSILFKMFEVQCESKTKKDWVSTIFDDMKSCQLNVTFSEIQEMTKMKWKNIVKQHIEEKTLRYLIMTKQSHSKVRKIDHRNLQMQEYMLPNKNNISKEDIQLIFKLRCKVMNVKMNFKNMYDSYECQICEEEEESQIHIYECKKIWEMKNQEKLDMPQYEMINNGNLNEQLTVAKIFKENYKILEIYKNNDDKKKCIPIRNQVTDDLSCLQYCNTEWKYID